MTTPRDPLYAGYRYPTRLIADAVWLYFWFPLSLRMVEEILAARGSVVDGSVCVGGTGLSVRATDAFLTWMPAVAFKLNQDCRHHIPRQQHKVTNWPAYEAGPASTRRPDGVV